MARGLPCSICILQLPHSVDPTWIVGDFKASNSGWPSFSDVAKFSTVRP